MSKKLTQKYVVGTWNEAGAFVPCAEQPETPITDLNDMIVWTRSAFRETPGSYSFVRDIPGKLEVSQQMTFFAVWGLKEDGVSAQ